MTLKEKALEVMAQYGDLIKVESTTEIPFANFIYALTNGDEVLQIGMTKKPSKKGAKTRLHKLFIGTLAAKDNKAFICGIYPVISGIANEYYLIEIPENDDLGLREKDVHSELGVSTNQVAACWFNDLGRSNIAEVHTYLWQKFKKTDVYIGLDQVEKKMAFELFQLVTLGKTMVTRTKGNVVPSVQGDNLEGNILKCVDKRYLANIWIKMCQGYFRYRSHKLPDLEFEKVKESYEYEEKFGPFVVHGKSKKK